jgi:hypothetical protein
MLHPIRGSWQEQKDRPLTARTAETTGCFLPSQPAFAKYLVDEGVLATACFNDRRLSGADSSVVMRGEHYVREHCLRNNQPLELGNARDDVPENKLSSSRLLLILWQDPPVLFSPLFGCPTALSMQPSFSPTNPASVMLYRVRRQIPSTISSGARASHENMIVSWSSQEA